MTDQVSVQREIGAPADDVWEMISDLSRMAEWSPENEGVKWLGGVSHPEPGARFRGTNRHGTKRWSTTGTVVEVEPGRFLSFRITAGGLPISDWRYEIESTPTGCRVTETWVDRRGRIAKALGRPVSGVADRPSHNRATMDQTLDRLKSAAESSKSP